MAARLAIGSLARVIGENPDGGPGPHYIAVGSIVRIVDHEDSGSYGCRLLLGTFDPQVYTDYYAALEDTSASQSPWEIVASRLEPFEE